jgi:glutathione S-transferase
MELYFAPMACSLATRIALYEAGVEAKFTAVDLKAKRTADGADFLAVNPMGQVPVLRTEADGVITENPVVLLYVADHCVGSDLAPGHGPERYRLQLWLNFITSELHKLVFMPLLSHKSNDGAKAFARDQVGRRFDYLNAHLDGRDYLLDRFTVADAYLVDGAQLDDADRNRPDAMAGAPRLLPAHAQARERRQGVCGGDGSLSGRAGPRGRGGVNARA